VAVTVIAQNAQPSEAEFLSLCKRFQTDLDSSLNGKKIPGVSAAVILSNGRSCTAASGQTDFTGGRGLTPNDPILAGSIGKTFVAAFAMQLVEEGKLALDDKIAKWLDDRSWFAKLPNANDITVRMLMNHSSGIPDHVDDKSFFSVAMKDVDRDVSYDYLLTFILAKKALFPAGQDYSYADTNYILLAIIEEKITGRAMYDEVATRFLSPFKLEHTTPANKNLDPAVHGFNEGKPVVKRGKLIINPQWEWAGGGFWSTPLDLAKWASALYGGNVLKKTTLDEMLKSRAPGDGKNYGLGVEIADTKWGPAYGHDGEWPGYISIMRFYPSHHCSVALQYNASGSPEAEAYGETIVDDLAGIFIEATMPKLSDEARSEFEKLTLAWLAKIDKRQLSESWDDISPALKAKYTRANWPNALKPLLSKTGALKHRTLKSATQTEPDAITVNFESSFEKLPIGREIVLLKRGADGKWSVSSYSIK
jgi:D-alanyl-D-alanine carboxypeptidase